MVSCVCLVFFNFLIKLITPLIKILNEALLDVNTPSTRPVRLTEKQSLTCVIYDV